MPGGTTMDTALVIVTEPYPAESSTTISPPGLVCAIAAANPRQGAASAHTLASLPSADTNVRCAVAPHAAGAPAHKDAASRAAPIALVEVVIIDLLPRSARRSSKLVVRSTVYFPA